jgi:hypothetical protein
MYGMICQLLALVLKEQYPEMKSSMKAHAQKDPHCLVIFLQQLRTVDA